MDSLRTIAITITLVALAGMSSCSPVLGPPSCAAYRAGDEDALDWALDHVEDRPDTILEDALGCSVMGGQPASVRELVEAGYDPNHEFRNSSASLLDMIPGDEGYAIGPGKTRADYIGIIKYLVAHGADPCQKSGPGDRTPIDRLEHFGDEFGLALFRDAGVSC